MKEFWESKSLTHRVSSAMLNFHHPCWLEEIEAIDQYVWVALGWEKIK